AQQTPEAAKEVAVFAAASNLITTTIGTYFTLFLSLPFTVWAYGVLEPILGRNSRSAVEQKIEPIDTEVNKTRRSLSAIQLLATWVMVCALALIGNYLAFKSVPNADVLLGLAIMIAVVVAGYAIYTLTRGVLPAVLWVSLFAMILTYPGT